MGGTRVGPRAIDEYLKRMRERYGRAGKEARSALLDEMEQMTGHHRKALIRSMNRPERSATRRRRTRRGRPEREHAI